MGEASGGPGALAPLHLSLASIPHSPEQDPVRQGLGSAGLTSSETE